MLAPVRTDAVAESGVESAPRAGGIPAEVWILAAITIVGAALRFATIAHQSYWYDEATTVRELHRSFGGLLHAVAHQESTPPLYYVLAWVWAKVFGTGEAGLRSFSALAGVAAIPVAYLCGRELVSRAVGLVAAALTALSPFLIWYSQEARAYMLLGLLCGLSFLFFVRSLRQPSTRNLGWWAASSSLAVLTHFFAGFLVAPEAIWLLIAVRRRAAVIAVGVVAVIQAALIPLLVGDVGHPLLGWIKGFPLLVRIKQAPVAFGLGTLYLDGSLTTQGLIIGAALIVVVVALVWFGADRAGRRGAIVAGTVVLTTLLVPLLLAAVGHDYYIARNLIGAWIPLAVLVAIACTATRTLPLGAALATLLAGAFVFAQVKVESNYNYQREDWSGVAGALGRASGQRAIVAPDSGAFATVPLSLYLPGSRQPSGSPVTVDELDVVGWNFRSVTRRLPPGTRLIGTRVVNQFLVARFALASPATLTPAAISAQAATLIGAASPANGILLQRADA
ncbi:MAG TPA: glycosyltransferase family 39 protein [Solirubrobacteraceae bacterium]|nr:glycosyltransferase family 39 protein [Solirubrobacteraceae bacterium]